MQFYTYLHCKPNGDPFYVGKGKGNRALNFQLRNSHHKNVVAKYGRANVDVFIFPRSSERDAFDTEIRWIAQFKREGLEITNKTDGGEGTSGANPSKDARDRMSNAQKGRKHSIETKLKIAAASTGKPCSEETRAKLSALNKGKKCGIVSAATRAKISEAHKGKIVSLETRAKLSAINSGKTMSLEARAKISAAGMGNKRMVGKTLSEETKRKISIGGKGKKRSPDTCSKISIARKAYWEAKRENTGN